MPPRSRRFFPNPIVSRCETMLNPDQAAPAPDQPDDLMDAQLQQELHSMFEVDTQKGLQTYLDQLAGLQPQTWGGDIQTLYRAIHTIKGGAVTVGADAILQVATVLEDLLSDLRHLEEAPP
jgi:HPt (histidine-containing phosphotransfer) domain-containing protein